MVQWGPERKQRHQETKDEIRAREEQRERQLKSLRAEAESSRTARLEKTRELNLAQNQEIFVHTPEGLMPATIDSFDEESGRVWVRGLDTSSRDNPSKPSLCSPFNIELSNSDKMESE